ncbi:MAG: potassium transporter [Zetaproteobacteria bacterium]|nr:MAG: potassium transporter [Zetaproteobacteria bacterium]
MIVPVFVAIYYQSGHAMQFVMAGMMVVLLGVLAMQWGGDAPERLSHKDGFLIVALAWIMLSALGSIPFLTTGVCRGVVDALFESTSGLTTTGATVLSGLDHLPPSILFWRSMQEWLGGMGIIVLAVAIMPMLGVGGMQLFKAEAPGPVKDKITARVTETAKVLWYLYLAMTMIAALALWLAGMSPFDAINHAMCTVAIGGFSTHDASIGYFDSDVIRGLMVMFMLMAGVNFTLHFASLRRRFSPLVYFRDDEFRAYFKWFAFLIVMVGGIVVLSGKGTPMEALFNVVSVATTTGFAVSDYAQWPPAANLLMLMSMFVGACAGSTGGGMKVVRILLLFRQGKREIRRLIHPQGVIQVKLGGQNLSPTLASALWGFFVLYLVSFAVIAVLVALSGVDVLTAVSAAAACLTNTGPGFGEVGPVDNFAAIPGAGKAVLMGAMILGRLEIYSFIVLLVPEFWRR